MNIKIRSCRERKAAASKSTDPYVSIDKHLIQNQDFGRRKIWNFWNENEDLGG